MQWLGSFEIQGTEGLTFLEKILLCVHLEKVLSHKGEWYVLNFE